MNWTDISKELQRPLDPKHVKSAPAGKYGDYVDGYHVVSEANRVFGEGGWSYSITRLELVSRITAETPKGPQIRIGYMCTVKVQIGDSFKEGAAVGTGVGKPDNEADIHESAVKEAETDALKRALRSYGNTFGLALYDKEKRNVRVDIQPATEAEIETAIENIGSTETLEALGALWSMLNKNAAHVVKSEAVITAKDERKAELARLMTHQGAA